MRTFTAIIHKEENIYGAECLEIGTVSQGYTVEEAIAMIDWLKLLCHVLILMAWVN